METKNVTITADDLGQLGELLENGWHKIATKKLVKEMENYTAIDAVMINESTQTVIHLTGVNLFIDKSRQRPGIACTVFPFSSPFGDMVENYSLDSTKYFDTVEDEDGHNTQEATENLPVKADAYYWDLKLGEKQFRVVQLKTYQLTTADYYTINILYYDHPSSVLPLSTVLGQAPVTLELLQAVNLLNNLDLFYISGISVMLGADNKVAPYFSTYSLNPADSTELSHGYYFKLAQGQVGMSSQLSDLFTIKSVETVRGDLSLGAFRVPETQHLQSFINLTLAVQTKANISCRILLDVIDLYYEQQYWSYTRTKSSEMEI